MTTKFGLRASVLAIKTTTAIVVSMCFISLQLLISGAGSATQVCPEVSFGSFLKSWL
jgi:hypothetical protein